ncbi:MAG: hypothetical protein JXA18_09400 [Chitinispirillaceae bacterium]|nr:hypothetical protein [Chitinispirillaceae bacterium]
MLFRKTFYLLLIILFRQAGAITPFPSVADTVPLPSIQHLSGLNSDDAMLLSYLFHYYFGPTAFTVSTNGSEEITKVRWLIDDAVEAQLYGEPDRGQYTAPIELDDCFSLTATLTDEVHTLTARITTADGDIRRMFFERI